MSATGRVTIAGKPSDDLKAGTLNSILKQAGLMERRWMRYAVVIEKGDHNYSAYVPALPGCVATGESRAEVEREIRAAVQFHIDGLKEDGLPIPEPTASFTFAEADA